MRHDFVPPTLVAAAANPKGRACDLLPLTTVNLPDIALESDGRRQPDR
jgi:hypothetical protein